MFPVVLVAALCIGTLAGGRFSHLIGVELHGLLYIFASVTVRLTLVLLAGRVSPSLVLCLTVHALSYGLLLYGLWRNKRIPEFRAIAFGSFLNFVAIACNGGRMPVSPEAIDPAHASNAVLFSDRSLTHELIGAATRLPYLCDIFSFTFLQSTPKAYSFGDLVIAAGLCSFIIRGMLGKFSPRDAGDRMNL